MVWIGNEPTWVELIIFLLLFILWPTLPTNIQFWYITNLSTPYPSEERKITIKVILSVNVTHRHDITGQNYFFSSLNSLKLWGFLHNEEFKDFGRFYGNEMVIMGQIRLKEYTAWIYETELTKVWKKGLRSRIQLM